METTALKKFAQAARRQLLDQVGARLEQVLRSDSVEIRERAGVVEELKAQIEASSKKAVIDRVAYTWFNRFCALRFMDVNHYTEIGVVSPVEGFTQPEILQEAKQGHIDQDLSRFVNSEVIFGLLNGQRPSTDPQQETYRLLLVGMCNYYNGIMPFMFEKIADYTELLMPLDLLSENSVLHSLREVLTPEVCQNVEVIGWLYQFYISERKDQVFEALKKNQKIQPEDIPAATQLFTPDWIVRYLVENSLGRLWMLNHPDSGLVGRMQYYIKPLQEETDFLKVSSPEELKICDPACGSGHMLTYAFDLLYAIYEEQGYPATDIPGLIQEKNLFGIEIDPRAGGLSAFALFMKARGRDKRFFTHPTQPHVCVLENVSLTDAELNQYMDAVGRDLFTEPLKETLRQFEQADNFGSLIRPSMTNADYVRSVLEGKNLGGDLFLFSIHERILKVLKYVDYLVPCYHVAVANPPYMNSSGMNDDLKKWADDFYPDSKSDLFAMFIDRNLDLVRLHGIVSMITMQSWMFLTSYERIRRKIVAENSILTMLHLGPRAFDTIGGAVVSTTAFVLAHHGDKEFPGSYFRLIDGETESAKQQVFSEARLSVRPATSGRFYIANGRKFAAIPGCPIAYWLSDATTRVFGQGTLGDYAVSGGRCKTHNDEAFVRYVWEVPHGDVAPEGRKWKLYNKGGLSRKWYGNLEFVVNWSDEAKRSYAHHGGLSNPSTWNKVGVTWSGISSGDTAYRIKVRESEYASASPTVLASPDVKTEMILGFLNTPVSHHYMQVINPTMQVNVGDALKLPFIRFPELERVTNIVAQLIEIARDDWNAQETSFDFTESPLLADGTHKGLLASIWDSLIQVWQNKTALAQQLEAENGLLFINAFGLQHELVADIRAQEMTLYSNAHYRYGDNKSEEELHALLTADTMREFISYSVGCMFGRYSLDKPGLVLANQAETLKDYLKQFPKPTFEPDADNVIPVLDGEWFNDDMAERFKRFLRVTFGEEHYDENLAFIEEAIGRDVRSYFVKEFYKDHLQMYKKRPIYWMFSSPKGSFNVLMYMHRYQPDTVSIVLNGYLREYVKKLAAHKVHLESISTDAASSQSQKTKALRELGRISSVLAELKDYERDLFELASKQIQIDLGDGVKVNYNKFGQALKPIPGLTD